MMEKNPLLKKSYKKVTKKYTTKDSFLTSMKSNVKLTQNNHYVLRKVKTDDALDDCSLRTNQAADNKIDQ